MSQQFQRVATIGQIKDRVASKFIDKLIDRGMVADRIGVFEKHGAEFRLIPTDQICRATGTNHVNRTATDTIG